ncbi:hypothetical protein ACLB2K_041347 [Fragaria x ananassa]
MAGRCPSESVRAWLGTVAIERCGPLCGESVRACLGTVAAWRAATLARFRWFYKPQIGKRPSSPLIEWARALGCLQLASLLLRRSTVSRYELVAFFVFGFVCGGGIVHMFVMLVGGPGSVSGRCSPARGPWPEVGVATLDSLKDYVPDGYEGELPCCGTPKRRRERKSDLLSLSSGFLGR